MSKIFGTILKFMPPWRRWAAPAAVCAAPAAVEIGGELLRGLQEPDALLPPALAAVALAASAAALARRRGDEAGMFPPLLRAADGGKSAASAPRRQGPESLAAAETSPRAGIAKKGALIGGSAKKGALTGARSGGMTEAESRKVVLDYLDHHPEVIVLAEQGFPYDKHGKRSMADQQTLRNARNGDAAELFGLSERFEHGEQGKQGVQQNKELAAKLRLFAAEGGHKEAQFKYGKMCEWDNDPIRRNSGEAEDFYRRAAEQGHVGAMFALGRLLYWKKDPSQQDLEEAEKWLRIAAEYGEARAQYMLVYMYVSGMGVGLSQEDAREWMRSHSTKIGHTPSLQLFDRSSNSPAPVESSGETEADEPPDAAGEAAPSSPANARSEEEKDLAARKTLKSAALTLIRVLPPDERLKEDGENDPEAVVRRMKTLEKVEELLAPEVAEWKAAVAAAEARAKRGMPEAETPPTIPQEYEAAGRRFKDLRAALRWVKPAADDSAPRTLADKLAAIQKKILPEAERQLEELQAKNRVSMDERDAQMEKNGTLAERWLTRAADQGHAESQFYLGYLYYHGICVRKDQAKASELWRRAADQGHPHAQFRLGLMYMPKDRKRSLEGDAGANTNMWRTLLRNAAEQGHLMAQVELRIWYAEPPGTRKQNWEEAYLMCHLAAEAGDAKAIDRREFYLDQISEQRQHAVIRKAEELHKKMLRAREKWREEHDALWGARGNQMWQWWFPLPSDDSSGGQTPPALPAPPLPEE